MHRAGNQPGQVCSLSRMLPSGGEGREGGEGLCPFPCNPTLPHPHRFNSHFLCFPILPASWPHFEDKELVAGSRGLDSTGETSGATQSPVASRAWVSYTYM